MVLFTVISLSIAFGLVVPVLHASRIAQNELESKRSYAIAESGIEDVLYRLKNAMEVSSTETLVLGTQETTTTITDLSSSGKEIVSIGDSNSRNRSITTTVTLGVGVSFNYGVQTGRGGITMGNNSQIIGNVYANGSITGSGSITGTAVAANTAALAADQVNDSPTTPPSSINFRNTSSTQDFAQSFTVSTDGPINKVQLYVRKTGSPANATVRIVADSSGSPSKTNLLTSQGTLSASLVTTSYGWAEVVLPSNPTLFAGTTYWLVIDNSSNSTSNYYTIGANDTTYPTGAAKTGSYGGSWSATSPSSLDGYFKIYLGGLTATINGIAVGTGGVGDAWANTITGGSVTGTKYCQVGTGCNTSRGDPPPTNFPISDANIATWKDDAEAGGTYSGTYTAVGTTGMLGPRKITGDLVVNNGAILTVTGTLWVQGNITLNNGGKIKLASSYGSDDGVIVTDGRVSINNNATFENSGTSGSYIMVVTTSDCPSSVSCGGANAIDVNNNAEAVILNAQQGTINLNNNAALIEATAEKLVLSNNATVTYQSGLADLNFSSGPSGSWSVDFWKETE